MSEAPVVWGAYADPGGRGVLEPVLLQLAKEGYVIDRFVSGWATGALAEAGIPFSSPDDAIARVHAGDVPALMISSMCTKGGEGIVEALMEKGIPCVAVQDFPGGSMHPGEAWDETRPTILTVTGEPARVMTRQLWPNFPPGNIVATGSPAVDPLANFNIKAARRQARETWGIPVDSPFPVFLFAGGGDPTGLTLFTLIKGVNGFGRKVHLVARAHPRFKNLPYWDEAVEAFGDMCVIDTLTDSDVTLAGADATFGCLSTLLEKAACLHLASCNLFGMSEQAYYPEFRPGSYPPVLLGCCTEATTWDELLVLLDEAHTGKLAARLRPAQEANYNLDGMNTGRVVGVCKEFLPLSAT
jgi:hypothetical protein